MEINTHASTVVPRPFLDNRKWPGYEAIEIYLCMRSRPATPSRFYEIEIMINREGVATLDIISYSK